MPGAAEALFAMLQGEDEIIRVKVVSVIEQLQHLLKCWLSCIDFSTHYKNTYMFKTADVYCSEITFFHNDALPSKRTRKLFCTKSVSESCEK